jgi:glycerol-3-phosphate cytidylyltransferase
MKTVFFSGSFDILNCGHVRAFKLASEQGDKLIIGLNSDDIIRQDKHREPIIPFEQRKEIIEAIRFVDKVIKVEGIYALPYIKELNADVFVTIKEWKDRQSEAIEWIIAKGGSIFTPPYFPDEGEILSSTDIRNRVIRQRVIEAGS